MMPTKEKKEEEPLTYSCHSVAKLNYLPTAKVQNFFKQTKQILKAMFSSLRQDGIIYVLDKRNVPTLVVGRVSAVSNPVPKYSTNFPQMGNMMETTVDITVNIDNTTTEFKKVPSNLSIYGENGVVISESKEAMMAEVESVQNASKKALDMIDYHNKVIPACDEIIAKLNPSIANNKAQEAKISQLENQVSSMSAALSKMNDMLEKLVN